MRAGEFADGARTLRAKIDMASGNINLRDPALYRIKKVPHQATGDAWCIYPMYDYAHALSDAIEGITHSLCTLEFEDHRPLYDWAVDHVRLHERPELLKPLTDAGVPNEAAKPRQIEFSRLNINYTVMSKRKLLALVNEKLVAGWDDPRMPTLQGIRRRGVPPEALHLLAERVGISKQNSVIDFSVFEGCIRDVLDAKAERRMAVIDPVKVTITNLPEGHRETLRFANHPKDEAKGQRDVPFSNALWIEREDFMEAPVKGFHRLVPGGEVRLRGAGILKCDEVVKDGDTVVELRCTLDPGSRPGMEGANRKVKGTIHWVCANAGVAAEVRLYDRLFSVEDPDNDEGGKTYRDYLNPDSIRVVTGYVEPAAAALANETAVQFERLGYFAAERYDHAPAKPVFNRTVTLRDSWAAKGPDDDDPAPDPPPCDPARRPRRLRRRGRHDGPAGPGRGCRTAATRHDRGRHGRGGATARRPGGRAGSYRGTPGKVDYACTTDADCAVKDVGSCCGYSPACVNTDSPTFPEQVKAECAKNDMQSVCGFRDIQGCACVEGRCEAGPATSGEAVADALRAGAPDAAGLGARGRRRRGRLRRRRRQDGARHPSLRTERAARHRRAPSAPRCSRRKAG